VKPEVKAQLKAVKRLIRESQRGAEKRRREDVALVLQNMEIFELGRPFTGLNQRQQLVAEARLAVVREVERLQLELGSFWAAAARLEKLSKKGSLQDALQTKIQTANIRSHQRPGIGVSASVLYKWHKLSAMGLEALAPAEGWNNALPDWVRPLFDLLGAMDKPSVNLAAKALRKKGYSSDPKRAKQYVRMVAEWVRAEKGIAREGPG
jgi:hypothetical protein